MIGAANLLDKAGALKCLQGWQSAHRVAKERANQAEETVLGDVRAAAAAPVPQHPVLPGVRGGRVAVVAKPAGRLQRREAARRQPCVTACTALTACTAHCCCIGPT